jgi:hypothetical protein
LSAALICDPFGKPVDGGMIDLPGVTSCTALA